MPIVELWNSRFHMSNLYPSMFWICLKNHQFLWFYPIHGVLSITESNQILVTRKICTPQTTLHIRPRTPQAVHTGLACRGSTRFFTLVNSKRLRVPSQSSTYCNIGGYRILQSKRGIQNISPHVSCYVRYPADILYNPDFLDLTGSILYKCWPVPHCEETSSTPNLLKGGWAITTV